MTDSWEGQDLNIKWTVMGVGFLSESDAKTFGSSLVNINLSNDKWERFTREEFSKKVLEPVDRFIYVRLGKRDSRIHPFP